MTSITIEFHKTITDLTARVSFNSSMTELQRNALLSDWKEFVAEVNKYLKQVEGIKFS